MIHTILINVRLDNSRSINQDGDLLYVTTLTTITKSGTKAGYPAGQLNLLPSIREKEKITTIIKDSNINSEFLGHNGFNLALNPQYNPSDQNSNPKILIDSQTRATLISELESRDNSLILLLNETFWADTWRQFREALMTSVSSAGRDEPIRILISSNDFRVESLPFRSTKFISQEMGLGSRLFSIRFVPPEDGYLTESDIPS
jgi:hypothetical protein